MSGRGDGTGYLLVLGAVLIVATLGMLALGNA